MCAWLRILRSSYIEYVNRDFPYSKLAVKSIDERFFGGDDDLKEDIVSLERLKDWD